MQDNEPTEYKSTITNTVPKDPKRGWMFIVHSHHQPVHNAQVGLEDGAFLAHRRNVASRSSCELLGFIDRMINSSSIQLILARRGKGSYRGAEESMMRLQEHRPQYRPVSITRVRYAPTRKIGSLMTYGR